MHTHMHTCTCIVKMTNFILFLCQLWELNKVWYFWYSESQLLKILLKTSMPANFSAWQKLDKLWKWHTWCLFSSPGGRTSSRCQTPAESGSDRSSRSEKAPNCLHEGKLRFGWCFLQPWQFLTCWWDEAERLTAKSWLWPNKASERSFSWSLNRLHFLSANISNNRLIFVVAWSTSNLDIFDAFSLINK